MPACQGKEFLVVAWEDLSGWPKARALASASSEAVAKFLWRMLSVIMVVSEDW